ncbi:baseplate J/gp47 family protein [Paenibacillus xanthanilyticus]
MKETAPYYTPEWRFSPDDPDPGTALFHIAADMVQESRKRLDRAPNKHFIEFLNLLQTQLQPARPARTDVVFELSEGARESVWIPRGTQLTAPSPSGGEELIFETDRPLLVTPAKLLDVINISPLQDRIVQAAEDYPNLVLSGRPEVSLFDTSSGVNLQEHAIYLRHDDLFMATHPAELTVQLVHAAKQYKLPELASWLAETEHLEWSYWSEGSWVVFDEVQAVGHALKLRKHAVRPVDELAVGGVEGRWIRCKLRDTQDGENPLLSRDLEVEALAVSASFDERRGVEGIPPTMMAFNDMELGAGGCYPFGEQFAPFAAFYMESQEAFGKREGTLTVRFRMTMTPNTLRVAPDPEIRWRMVMRRTELDKKDPPRVRIQRVMWEYWNGSGWMRIPGTERYETLFGEMPEGEAVDCTLTFECPRDLERTFVNAQYGFWIRARVTAVDNLYAPEMIYVSPYLEQIKLRYAYDARTFAAENALTFNNAALRDVSHAAAQGGLPFRVFEPLDSREPAVVMGFDAPLLKGPIRLQLALQPGKWSSLQRPWIEWEALVLDGRRMYWKGITAADETNGMTEQGAVQFAAPPDMARTLLYGRERYWIRAVNRDRYFDVSLASDYPVVSRIDLNAVPALQQSSIRSETPTYRQGVYSLSRTPVIAEEIWVDETGTLIEPELSRRLREYPDDHDVLYDSEGDVHRVWVRWQGVESLTGSGSEERHYLLDRAAGTIRFGDGVRGRAVPLGGPDGVRCHYKVTAGAAGNLPAGSITGLLQSVAFVARVANPAPAGGGCDTERIEAAQVRGPERLKHQGRAVTASDFEWLAREAYPGLSKVKCLPNRDVLMRRAAGAITLVVLADPGEAGHALFPSVKRQIETYLIARAANTITVRPTIQVTEPAFLEVSVKATVTAESMDQLLETEEGCLAKLRAFLDPGSGHFDGKGWEIGEEVHASLFYSLLKSVRTVKNIDHLYMSIVKVEDGRRIEIDPAKQAQYPHGIVRSGQHRIDVLADEGRR